MGLAVVPYALLIAATLLVLIAIQGTVYCFIRTTETEQEHAGLLAWKALGVFAVLYWLLGTATLVFVPHLADRIVRHPWIWPLPLLTAIALWRVNCELRKQHGWHAFLSCGAAVISVALLAGLVV
jgi:cytochrome d ubiquinol oxidase subunit II